MVRQYCSDSSRFGCLNLLAQVFGWGQNVLSLKGAKTGDCVLPLSLTIFVDSIVGAGATPAVLVSLRLLPATHYSRFFDKLTLLTNGCLLGELCGSYRTCRPARLFGNASDMLLCTYAIEFQILQAIDTHLIWSIERN